MPAPAPFASAQPLYPALYLYPLNDSFIPKHISLAGGQRVKIGRQTNAKTVPAERNGYFDSKVLSRQHAEVWEENSKVRRSILERDSRPVCPQSLVIDSQLSRSMRPRCSPLVPDLH